MSDIYFNPDFHATKFQIEILKEQLAAKDAENKELKDVLFGKKHQALLESIEAKEEEWIAKSKEYQSHLAKLEAVREALVATRGQWIHSVNAEKCLKALAALDEAGTK